MLDLGYRRSTAEEQTRLLSLVDIFEPLTREELEQVDWERFDARLAAGEVLYGPADRCDALFVLKKGRVRIYKKLPEGREFTLAVVGGGTVFGELSLTGQKLRGSYARAVEDSEVSVICRRDLERLVLEKPQVGLKLLHLLCERLAAYETRLEDLGLKEVPARLANLILMLIESEGVRAAEGYKLPARYTHRELGTMIGANREAVTRAFARLRKAGAVRTEGRHIVVDDLDSLRAEARTIS